MNKKISELQKRILYTVFFLAIYLIGRSILLSNIDVKYYEFLNADTQNILYSLILGDRYSYTIFALGIMPFTTAALIIQMYAIFRGKEYRSHISPQKTEFLILVLTVLLSWFYAVTSANNLIYIKTSTSPVIYKTLASFEMFTGAMIVYYICKLNGDYGIGKQTPFLLINLIDTIHLQIKNTESNELSKILPLAIVVIVLMIIIEVVTIKIPVQRISIHNEYAKNSYIGFKINPVGIMPVMLAVSFYMIPQLLVKFLLSINEESELLNNINDSLNLNNTFGVVVYLIILFILTYVLAFVMLSPNEIASQLQRSGDSIVGVYAGIKTEKYISKVLLILSTIGGFVMCLIMGTSLFMALNGKISSEIAMFPSTIMFLVGSLCSMYKEIKGYYELDSYKFFM